MEIFRGYAFSTRTVDALSNALKNEFLDKQPVFLCLGTDRIVGDCLAPLTADIMRQRKLPFYIYGGLNAPITAKNCEFACDFIRVMHPNSLLVLIDSMATRTQANLGDIVVNNDYFGAINALKIQPDLCIYGVVSMLKNNLLNCARLRNVEYIARVISNAIENALSNSQKEYIEVK